MARKKNKKSGPLDPLGGFSIDQLFGLDLLDDGKKKKRGNKGGDDRKGMVSRLVALPMALVKAPVTIITRLLGGIIGALGELLRLPLRVLGAIAKPWRRS